MTKKVLLTGATGFLGSNIVRKLVEEGYCVFCTHRENSSFERVKDLFNSITWINIEKNGWFEELIGQKFDILIHAAWDGVSVSDRNDWELQLKNFEFSKQIFNVVIDSDVKKIISIGSQAEYGNYNKKVSESFVPLPYDAYGAAKLLTLYYLQSLAERRSLEWYWLRVFSVFGRGENENGLIPHVIKSLQNNDILELTEGRQVYDYLHSDDFVTNFMKVFAAGFNSSGIYNLCSGVGIEIKSLITKIAASFPHSHQLLEFGKIPYRDNQNMYMVGSNEKFESAFGQITVGNLDFSIQKAILFI